MKRYEVSVQQAEGYETFVLSDRATNAEARIVPALGNNVYSFSVNGEQLLLVPPSLAELKEKPSRFGVPILFPPNRTAYGTFSYEGRTYTFPPNNDAHYIHGELCRRCWAAESSQANETEGASLVSVFRFADHPDIIRAFPHPYTFRLTYRLAEGRLELEGEVHNGGTEKAPFGLGFHPYFSSTEDATVVVPANTEYAVQDTFVAGLPAVTGLSAAYRTGVPAREIEPSGYKLFRMEDGVNRSEIRLPASGTTIVYETDAAFPFMVVFKPHWGASISLEPYSIVTDGFNLPWPAEVTGVRGVDGGVTVRFHTSIYKES
ncbi:aldose 1-epimerase [Paenibacillus sp. HJGM_3]|uniref:aldose 1-epimerase n=1 Tax=Paenibacillus sp. HJGM_3 TaxID=3379816 RepID=UPI003858074A